MENSTGCKSLTDQELLSSLKRLVSDERRAIADVLRHLAEVDDRKLYADAGYPSLFEYCTRELRYSEGAAARRIHAARAASDYRVIYRLLAQGGISLSAVSMLAPHLSAKNHKNLLRQAAGKSKREVERLLSPFTPERMPVDRIRHIACLKTEKSDLAAAGGVHDLFNAADEGPSQREEPREPASPEEGTVSAAPAAAARAAVPMQRVQFSFMADEDFLKKVQRARELLRAKQNGGKLEDVFGAAMESFLELHDPERKLARKNKRESHVQGKLETLKPRIGPSHSRLIPQEIKDSVWRRDQGRCVFVGAAGNPCGAREGLEFDHVLPWARGGTSLDSHNVRLLCRTHNQLLARRTFGPELIARRISENVGRG